MTGAHDTSAATTDPLLPCPLCRSLNVLAGTCYAESGTVQEPAARCGDCGCRATRAAWQSRGAAQSPLEADVDGLEEIIADLRREKLRLHDALKNMMGAYDTPVSRRRFPPDEFMKEAIESGRAALAAQPPAAPVETDKIMDAILCYLAKGCGLILDDLSAADFENLRGLINRAPVQCSSAGSDYEHGRLYVYDATSQTFDLAEEVSGAPKFDGDRVTILQSDFDELIADRRELMALRSPTSASDGDSAGMLALASVIEDATQPDFLQDILLDRADRLRIVEALRRSAGAPNGLIRAVPQSAWQPIETAPDDGTSVLIADARTHSYGEAYYDYAPDQKRWYWANTGAGDYPEPREPFPTHWQPLPTPPVTRPQRA